MSHMNDRSGCTALMEIMERLRGEGGCPWDRAQTHESLKQYFLEEAYEVAEAIDNKDPENLKEELGDMLLQVVFHAQIAAEDGDFTLAEVSRGICDKMVRRHPPVFGGAGEGQSWEELKRAEKGQTNDKVAALSVPRAMPALMRAQKVQKKAGAPEEEAGKQLLSLCQGLCARAPEEGATEAEIGALLWAAALFARKFDINAELALTNATEQFINNIENAG